MSERSKLQAPYGRDETVDGEKIPELDLWLEHDDGFISLEEACSGRAPFDRVPAERARAGEIPGARDRSHTWEYTLQMPGAHRRSPEAADSSCQLVCTTPAGPEASLGTQALETRGSPPG